MAKCSGCAGGLTEVFTDGNNCIDLDGSGTIEDPLVPVLTFNPDSINCLNCDPDGDGLTLIIDPDIDNALTCGENGLFVESGGAGGGQVLYFTVGTPGPVAFAGFGATPAALLATADYTGNGVNDSVAIQQALDDANDLAATLQNVVVKILPGIYLVNTTLETYGVRVMGMGATVSSFLTSNAIGGASPNTRTINNVTVGAAGLWLEDIGVTNDTEAAAIVSEGIRHLRRVQIETENGHGADAAAVVITTGASGGVRSITDCSFTVLGPAVALAVISIFDYHITGNFFLSGGILVDGCINTIVSNNIIEGGSIGIALDASNENIVQDNIIRLTDTHGIFLTGSNDNSIDGNHLIGYDSLGLGLYDGILLAGNSDFNTVINNRCGHNTARYGINVSAATCNENMVTNNDLRLGGSVASFNDAGTGTVTAAGNRV